MPTLQEKVRPFQLFLKVKQGNVDKHEVFRLMTVWDKVMKALKWGPLMKN